MINNLKEILEKHKKWLKNESGGERAYLRSADLRGAYLRSADLRGANLRGAYLYGADLRGAYLYGADLESANLRGADLRDAGLRSANLYGADLRGADLRGADLESANLRSANLRSANLKGANLESANLRGAYLESAYLYGADLRGADFRDADFRGANLKGAKNVPFIPMICPDSGEFIGWKKCKYNHIVKIKILEDAKRSSATGRKCRCNKALVLEIQNTDGETLAIKSAKSNHDPTFVYTVGEIVEVADFCEDRFEECAPGIHFFINREEAVNY